MNEKRCCFYNNTFFIIFVFSEYRVVVVTARENEDKAHIVPILDRFRVAHPDINTAHEVQDYLQTHYTVNNLVDDILPATLYDPEQ